MEIIDLTMPLDEETQTHPTHPSVEIKPFLTHGNDGFNVLQFTSLCTHTGTHVDFPSHLVLGGPSALDTSLDIFVGEAVAVSIPKGPGEVVTPEELPEANIRQGDILLVSMGWEKALAEKRFFDNAPGFSVNCAKFLIDKGVKCIATDSPSIDPLNGSPPLFHFAVLEAGLGVVEGLVNLDKVVGKRFLFSALPLKITGGDGSPVRAVAMFLE
ncbi:cyclase family protein [Candidatus Hydrogenedentota bacterium]